MKWSDGEVTVREDGDTISVEFEDSRVAEVVGDLIRRNAGEDGGFEWLGRTLCKAASNVELFHAEDVA